MENRGKDTKGEPELKILKGNQTT